jgi:hypothetical protein
MIGDLEPLDGVSSHKARCIQEVDVLALCPDLSSMGELD